ncbi:MAG: hypothetical protein ACYDHM_13730 [Acidiferrobacterales bacterium]
MSKEFEIQLEWLEGADRDPMERSTFAQIEIHAAHQIATELEDLFAQTVRPGLRASAYDLAVWFAENWWRLRWEPDEATADDWRLSHIMAAAGGGIAWPDISFASDGVHVLVESHKTSGGHGAPIRYIRDIAVQISAGVFETGIDEFVQRVLARLSSVKLAQSDLGQLWQQLLAERGDEELSAMRRLEALLGFDLDEAPSKLIAFLQSRINEAGLNAVEEIAAAAKQCSSETLQGILEQTSKSSISIRIESASGILKQYSDKSSPTELPWQRAEVAAKLARNEWGIGKGPVSNNTLSELLHVSEDLFKYTPSNGLPVAAGFRTNHGTDKVSVVMRAKVETGRRFEIMRMVADHIVAPSEDRLLPVTAAKTDRQKFQRAFAQEFLLPFEELYDRLGQRQQVTDLVSDDDVEDVARDYDVSPLLVRTAIVNRGLLARDVRMPAMGKHNTEIHKGAAKMTTSKRDATKASKLLRNSGSAAVRSVAGSDLAQARHKKRAPRKLKR